MRIVSQGEAEDDRRACATKLSRVTARSEEHQCQHHLAGSPSACIAVSLMPSKEINDAAGGNIRIYPPR